MDRVDRDRTVSASTSTSAWAPLQIPLYRTFWFASLAANLGTWIHEVGAGWLMASLDPSPQMVAAVRTVMAAPIIFLAIPVGVLGDRIDRRRMLILTQFVLCACTATLALLTFSGIITANLLLVFTFIIGLGMVVHVPIWQASIPELVPKNQLARAIALGSISFNLARAVGPAVGGVLIALAGVWTSFALNAMSFAGVMFVLLSWKRARRESSRGLSFRLSMYQGLRYVAKNLAMRHTMLGVVLFVWPASALWSLLPLVAKEHLRWGASGFGFLVGCMGAGAVLAAWLLPHFQRARGADQTIAISMVGFAGGLALLANVTNGILVCTATLIMGASWMMTLTTLNSTAQMTLPSRMRARGMGCYLTAMAFSMSSGSIAWGQLAEATSITTAQTTAAAILIVAAAASLKFRVGDSW
ncbi:enterobactin exporter EntS [Novipirellula galeiformis]|uniref:Enterobactin exporter EntS n=1 Tax=Novipirellula galeiformis TaxID=2528004 RepID=A0A5C6CIT7_9BACT|nr:MFS transporter [Novipirellula galeiformis]TWU23344.1 enterobactin exporter EntS [Novipirellula galeiformis]